MQSLSTLSLCAFAFRVWRIAAIALLALAAVFSAQAQDAGSLARWASAPHRTPANVARDGFRHPLESLLFFGVKDTSNCQGRKACVERVAESRDPPRRRRDRIRNLDHAAASRNLPAVCFRRHGAARSGKADSGDPTKYRSSRG